MPRLAPDYHGHYKPPRMSYLRSCLPILALILVIAFGLSSYSLLSHFRSPAVKQQIGWQAWDVVEMSSSKSQGGVLSAEGDETQGVTNGTGFVPSIPLEKWDPLALHTTGLTEIAVKPCYFPPYLFPSYCAPKTTPELDKAKGKWVVVDRDLNLRTGLWYLNVYYRRTRRLDADLITDLRIVTEPPNDEQSAELKEGGWIKSDGDVHNGVWPTQPEKRIWYKTRRQEAWRDDWKLRERDWGSDGQTYEDFITEIDILYGDDDPFFGFERIKGGKLTPAKEGKWESVDVVFRRGNPVAPRATVPTFHADGTFKIMQIADLHYSVGTGKCRDTDKQPCVGDEDTAAWLAEALDAEQPDLVVFSGDQLNGQSTSYDTRSVLAKFAKPVIDRKIPWAAVFGNHDSEIVEDRDQHMRALQRMPYSLSRAGPKAVDGVGNYYIKLHSSDGSNMHIFTLYFLDSHAYQKKALPWRKADYDYIKASQLDWYRNVSASIKPIARPFRPDGADDLGHIWRRHSPARLRADGSSSGQTLAKPNAMMWFHIPLPEAYADADVAGFDAEALDMGVQLDGQGNSKHNSGFFYNAIKASFEVDEDKSEIKVLSHGHCHNTDRCRRIDGVWMCFDGGSSFSGYGQLGFDRRVRVYRISNYGEKIETYKRLSQGDIIDEQILVGDGAAEGWGESQ
ncbi:hypothetical protein I316_04556 [Kwoniella heveanensis BCC8398]|uniref:Calcineurin-like phosphoesterase domain-containing protein n=1 Tax=Kwoniella heveanensis BCC8398 TaxID=1296120 RepID=A0A1B9GS03_9TREE|nr:hypothetical protein I316_04556 [Kwoniella heveanensis BCC8398]